MRACQKNTDYVKIMTSTLCHPEFEILSHTIRKINILIELDNSIFKIIKMIDKRQFENRITFRRTIKCCFQGRGKTNRNNSNYIIVEIKIENSENMKDYS